MEHAILKHKKKTNVKDLMLYIALIALPLAQISVMYFAVNFNSFILAFKAYGADGELHFAGFSTLVHAAKSLVLEKNWLIAIKNSVLVWLFTTIVPPIVNFAILYYMYKKRFAWNFFLVMFVIPTTLSAVVVTMTYQTFCEYAIPAIVERISGAKIAGLLSSEKTRVGALLLYMFWVGGGTSLVYYLNAMKGIPESETEAAKLDGVGAMQEFFHIIFPHVFNLHFTFLSLGIVSIFTLQFNLFEFYGTAAETAIQTFGYVMFVQTMTLGEQAYPQISALGLMISVIAIPVTMWARGKSEKIDPLAD